MWARKTRIAALTVVLSLLFAGCIGDRPESGVNVKSLATDLVYGIPETPAPAPPANQDPVPDEPAGVQVIGGGETRPFEPAPIEPAPGQELCPEASRTDFPQPTTSEPEGRPQQGEYQWMVEGTQVLPTIGRIPLPRRTNREIREVEDIEGGWRFTSVEPEVSTQSNDVVSTTYEVRAEAGPTGDPGVFISEIIRQRDDGTVRSRFQPSPAVQILPFPVEPGVEVTSVGVDPANFSALRIEGSVTGRHRVDACGDVIEGWLVDGVSEFVSPSGESSQRNYDYAVAPHMGGMLIFEHVDSPCPSQNEEGECTNDPDLTFDTRLGQVEPDELEE